VAPRAIKEAKLNHQKIGCGPVSTDFIEDGTLVGDGWFFRTGGCSGDSEELKTLKTLTAVSGHGRAKENK